MSEKSNINRRAFIGAGLLSAGGVAGWLAARRRGVQAAPAERPPLGARFTYDVSAYQQTDPALLRYDETGRIPTGFRAPKCIEMTVDGTLLVGGDQAVKVMDPDGTLRSTLTLPAKPHAVTRTSEGRTVVAFMDHVAVYDADGKLVSQGSSLGEKSHLTSVAAAGDSLYVADAGQREIVRCDTAGKPISRFGRIGAGDGNPGFMIPSAYFDVMLGSDGLLWVNNMGRHRVEAYTLEGEFELGWGEPGMAVENFCGCCNPVYFTRLPDGRFVTSEKGLNRIKLYDAKGAFAGVVAGPDHLVKDLDQARRACADCRIGFGFDVACDAAGRIYALDPAAHDIRIFTPKASAS
jgi:hypothetical protein